MCITTLGIIPIVINLAKNSIILYNCMYGTIIYVISFNILIYNVCASTCIIHNAMCNKNTKISNKKYPTQLI